MNNNITRRLTTFFQWIPNFFLNFYQIFKLLVPILLYLLDKSLNFYAYKNAEKINFNPSSDSVF